MHFRNFLDRLHSFFTPGWSIFLLILCGIITYSNVLVNGFVGDDGLLVSQNVLLNSFANIPQFFLGSGFYTGGTQLQGNYYRPLTPVMLTLIVGILGNHAFVFHAVQILFHILNAVLLFFIFRRFFKNILSFFLASIFLLHPIQVEAVVYISDMQDVLFTTFGLISLLFLIYYYPKKMWKLLSVIAVCLCVSLFFKEVGVLFFLICGMYLFLYRRDVLLPFVFICAGILCLYLPLRVAAVGLGSVTDKTFPIMQLSLSQRLLTIPKVIFTYLHTFFFPKDLLLWQQWVVTSLSVRNFYVPFLFDLGIFAALFWLGLICLKKKKEWGVFLFFGIWFGISLLAHSQIIPLDGTVSDRWFYVPIIGLLGILGLAASRFQVKKDYIKLAAALIGVIILICLSIRTMVRNSNWKDGLTLYSHDEKLNSDSFSLENGLGFELAQVGKYDEAIVHLHRSTTLMPNWPVSWSNLAGAYGRRGIAKGDSKDLEKAKEYYRESIKKGIFFQAYQNLAKVMVYEKDYMGARTFLEESVKKLPDNPSLWLLLSQVDYQVGSSSAALQAASKAYNLSPSQEIYNWALYISSHPTRK